MLRELLLPLVKYFSPFNIFRYLTFRSAYAAITALLIVFLFGPTVIRKLGVLKFGQSVREDGPQSHLAKMGTPTMGGILIIVGVAVSVMLWQDVRNPLTWIVLFALVGFGAIGMADDLLKIKKRNSDGLSPVKKLLLQFTVSMVVTLGLYFIGGESSTKLYIPFFKTHILDLGVFWIPVAMIYVTAWSNAVNITDGLDGLATGLVIMAIIAFAILTYVSGRADWADYLKIPYVKGAGELTVFNLALLGACTGFLWFNSHPAVPDRQERNTSPPHRWCFCHGTRFRDASSALFQGHEGQAPLPHGTSPPSLRTGRAEGNQGCRPFLDNGRHVRAAGAFNIEDTVGR